MKKEEFERVDMRIPDYENTWSEISRSSSLYASETFGGASKINRITE